MTDVHAKLKETSDEIIEQVRKGDVPPDGTTTVRRVMRTETVTTPESTTSTESVSVSTTTVTEEKHEDG